MLIDCAHCFDFLSMVTIAGFTRPYLRSLRPFLRR
jgi:hypothetical protein